MPVIGSVTPKSSVLMILVLHICIFQRAGKPVTNVLFASRGCSTLNCSFSTYAPENIDNDKMFCGTDKYSSHNRSDTFLRRPETIREVIHSEFSFLLSTCLLLVNRKLPISFALWHARN